jgi:drug/metabolite transporter (DMT)-like permease
MTMAAVVIWAAAFPLIKVALDEVPPITMALARFAIASAFFLALQFTIGGGMAAIRRMDRTMWLMVITFGIVQSAVTNIAQNIGMQWTSAGIASIIQSVGPVFAVFFAIGFLGEVGFGGGDTLDGVTLVGNARMVVTAAAYAVGGTIAKYVLRDVDPTTMMAVGTPFALIPLAIGATFEDAPLESLANASMEVWGSIVFLALLATGVTMILWYRVLARVELSHLAYFVYLIPVFSVAISWVILGETIALVQAVFAGLIIAGVAVAQRERPSTAAAVVGAGCEEGPEG